MFSTRRSFLKQLGAAGVIAVGSTPPAFLARTAAGAESRQSSEGRILVLVELAGGNDGLNTVIPHGDDAYYQARPGIAVPKDTVLKLDDYHGLHPQLTGFRELFEEGRLAIVQGVGYPNPDRSHFRSMDIWHSAVAERDDTRDGWLGRAMEQDAKRENTAGSEEKPRRLSAIALGAGRLPLALVGSGVAVPMIDNPDEYKLRLPAGAAQNNVRFGETLRELATVSAPAGSDLEFLRRTTRTAVASAERLKEVMAGYKPAVEYPGNGLGQKLKLVAQMIAGDLDARIFFVSLGGFDTHSQQQGAHQALLAELSSAVQAFVKDLAGHGLTDRVLLATFSEFGRRVKENGSLGTDHGAASQMFVVTPSGKGGVRGAHPSLADLDDGDLKSHTDFRSVYASILSGWLNVPAEPVLG